MRIFVRASCALIAIILTAAAGAAGAELTTGTILGNVQSMDGKPLADARVTVFAPSGIYSQNSDGGGHLRSCASSPTPMSLASRPRVINPSE